jgi:predicted dehydrogenase
MRRTRIFYADSYVSLDFAKRYGLLARKRAGAPRLSDLRLTPEDLRDRTRLQSIVLRDLVHLEEKNLDEGEPLRREIEAFLRAVRERARPVVTGEDGLRALEVALEILRGLRRPEDLGAVAANPA